MYQFTIHDDATADLREIIATDRPAGLKLYQVLRQLMVDQDSLDRLTQASWGGTPSYPRPKNAKFNTGPWGAAQIANMNLWRLRFFNEEIAGYRLIHAFFPSDNEYYLLAIVEKAEFAAVNDDRFNYELTHPISVRIASAYQALVDR